MLSTLEQYEKELGGVKNLPSDETNFHDKQRIQGILPITPTVVRVKSPRIINYLAIGILTESKIYLAKIKEFDYTHDDLHLIYRHHDPVYPLQTFAPNNIIHRLYICSPSTIYTLDLQVGSHIVPFLPVDDTPCRANLVYLSGQTTLLWTLRHTVMLFDFNEMFKERLWNSTSPILNMIYNDTDIDNNAMNFYLSVSVADQQSVVVHCRTDRRSRIVPFQSCLFIDSGYHEVSTLAYDENRLYVADRIAQKIYVLALLPSGFVLSKNILPLNTSIVADIQSMFVYDYNLVWLTTSGHVRIVSLITYEVRTIFWFDEELKAIHLVSFGQWPNRTTTSTTTTTTTITTTITTTTTTTTQSTTTYSISTEKSTIITTSPSEHIDTSTIDNVHSPWKATTFVTSIILGIALFLCAAMVTCVLLNYRLGRVVPSSFTNVLHFLRNRTQTASTAAAVGPSFFEESLT
ncbi:unnamed protein product [Adineta steineri]|nr:unnamed protein product [Adineta steineri]CAF1169635.1 unnamed protein product [Adineta steineri]